MTSCHTRSAMNGVSGAMSRVSTSSVSCSVAKAAVSPRQKRRRERRTYQFDMSSTNDARRAPAACVSNFSSDAVTSRVRVCSSDSSHWSSTSRSATGGTSPVVGVHPSVPAYRTWKAVVFQ
jgi:hypothetical protein